MLVGEAVDFRGGRHAKGDGRHARQDRRLRQERPPLRRRDVQRDEGVEGQRPPGYVPPVEFKRVWLREEEPTRWIAEGR